VQAGLLGAHHLDRRLAVGRLLVVRHAGFKQHLRDFLVQLKEFGDSTDLYADERKEEADLRAKDLRTRQEAIPGLINPHARNDDMMGD